LPETVAPFHPSAPSDLTVRNIEHTNMNPKKPLRARLTSVPPILALAAILAFPASRALAGDVTLLAGNSPFSTNLTGAGTPLDGRFTFELGAFDTGWTPTAFNTVEWLEHWHPVTDAGGNPLPGAAVAYDDSELGAPFPAGARANQFTITVTLTHNAYPFAPNAPVYIWGYDRREGGGSVEWILITNPGWTWPAILPGGEPALRSFDIAHPDSIALFGHVNENGFEMRTATVGLSTGGDAYNAWLLAFFPPGELNDSSREAEVWGFSADADGDGIPNAIEFLSGTIPTSAGSRPAFAVDRSGAELILSFTRLRDSGPVAGTVEWSTDLTEWTSTGVTETVAEDLGAHERIEARVTVPAGNQAYMRLAAAASGGVE